MNVFRGYPADVMHRDKTHLRISPASGLQGVLEELSLKGFSHLARSPALSLRCSYKLNVF